MSYQKQSHPVVATIVTTVIIIILAMMVMTAFSQTPATTIPSSFFNAIEQVEGRHGDNDNGAALGPYQIHKKYWEDSKVKGTYAQCRERAYSRQVMVAYLERFGHRYIVTRDYKALARIHNGGPDGNTKSRTVDYANRVVNLMGVFKDKKGQP